MSTIDESCTEYTHMTADFICMIVYYVKLGITTFFTYIFYGSQAENEGN